jgi:succinoglycan biosynthesis protein ExoL
MIDRKLLFIQSTFGDAHQMIRFLELSKHYKESQLLAFERTYYETTQAIDFINLGEIHHGKLISRISVYFKAMRIIFNEKSTNSPTDIYFFGFDLLPWIAVFGTRNKCRLIFEIPDIRESFFQRNLAARLMKSLLKYSLKPVFMVVVTSELFVNRFLKNHAIVPENYCVLENKVHLPDNALPLKEMGLEIVIGFFGLIRCEKSLQFLLQLLDSTDKFKLLIYGYFINISQETQTRIKEHPKVSFKGAYKSPQDLKKIYSQIDLSWVAYPFQDPSKDGNFRYAMTNRYYEAGFFRKPMIGNKHSGDAEKIEANAFGLTLDLNDFKGAMKSLTELNRDKVDQWKQNLKASSIIDYKSTDNDYNVLVNKLNTTS